MFNNIYSKMGISNIKKNKEAFLPFIICSSVAVMMFYMMVSISSNVSEELYVGANTMSKVLSLGIVVIGLFSAIILFYTNGFLVKKRNKELGLYSVLGLEKKHIGYIVFYEVIISGLISIVCGLVLGIIFSKFVFLLLLNIVKLDVPFIFSIPIKAVFDTILLFILIYIVIIAFDCINIRRLNIIDIINESKAGEREPKTRWVPALIGAVCISVGYYLSLTVEDVYTSVPKFAESVILVIIGTYLVFIFLINIILKGMRKSDNYYNKKTHFFVVSSMIYRMKQNAAGLATICILSTMVMVVASSGICLYAGIDDSNVFPYDVTTSYMYDYGLDREQNIKSSNGEISYDPELIKSTFETSAKEHGISIKNDIGYYYFDYLYKEDGINFNKYEPEGPLDVRYIGIIDMNGLEAFNKSKDGENLEIEKLDEGEVYVYLPKGKSFSYDRIKLCGIEFRVKRIETLDEVIEKITVVVPSLKDMENINFAYNDNKTMTEIMNESDDGYSYNNIQYKYFADIEGEEKNKLSFGRDLRDTLNNAGVARVADVTDRYTTKQEYMGIYGGIFFVGIFLSILFLMATGMIIYYKQLSEGYDDKERFAILKKIGLSNDEASKIIRHQVLLVFFMPIAVSVVHVLFSINIVTKFLKLLGMTNRGLFVICTFIVILVFILVYVVMYFLSSKAYKKIVIKSI